MDKSLSKLLESWYQSKQPLLQYFTLDKFLFVFWRLIKENMLEWFLLTFIKNILRPEL